MSCARGAQQQTRRTPLLLSIDRTDRRTDRWTDGRIDKRTDTRLFYDAGYANRAERKKGKAGTVMVD